jgi:hypothetical protein
MKPLSERSRFQLTIEAGVCGIVLFFASLVVFINPFIAAIPMVPLLIYLNRLQKILKKRHEAFTRREKRIIFGIGLSFVSFLVFVFLLIALRTNASLAWILFALAALTAAACVFASYRQLYVDEA